MQIGGNHYKNKIQVWDYIDEQDIGFMLGNILKYVCRYDKKNGKEDLEKALSYVQKYGENKFRRFYIENYFNDGLEDNNTKIDNYSLLQVNFTKQFSKDVQKVIKIIDWLNEFDHLTPCNKDVYKNQFVNNYNILTVCILDILNSI